MEDKIPPAQKQYQEIKKKHEDAILFFRMGDFYEMFGEDAKIASKVLGLTLTTRDRKSKNPLPMAGVPYHSVNKYIAQLSRQGYKIAICEQLSDPSLPGIVERDVVRVVTPGTLVEEDLLEQKKHNFIVSIAEYNNRYGISYLDVSTGDFFIMEVYDAQRLLDELYKLNPAEIIFTKKWFLSRDIMDRITALFHVHSCLYSIVEDPYQKLVEHFNVKTLRGFGADDMDLAIKAAGTLLGYVEENEKAPLRHIISLKPLLADDYMHLDETTIRHLDLLCNNHDGKREGSLLAVLDRTATSMGARLLTQWILHPLVQQKEIEDRLSGVEFFFQQREQRKQVYEQLRLVSDVERILARMVFKKANPRDLVALRDTITLMESAQKSVASCREPIIVKNREKLANDDLRHIQRFLSEALEDMASASLEKGGIIKKGYHREIDELRSLVFDGRSWVVQYQEMEQQRTGIPTLKVGYNKVFGYYIEISKGQIHKVPDMYVRKQTLTNAERYITSELQEYEQKVAGAEEKLLALEKELFFKLQETIIPFAEVIKNFARAIAVFDVLQGFAQAAETYGYTRPHFTPTSGNFQCINGRHPVLERWQWQGKEFIPNNCLLGEHQRLLLITGPNMAGKSTFLRQNALLILMAQMGSFVPAESLNMDIVDRIFTRIGTSDILTKGQSTFLVEMQETANIINNATKRSFIILDEVGRGTSTYDGLSLAWSILEYLHDHTQSNVLFATHYHELIPVAEKLPFAANYCVAVSETADGVVFLHKVKEGGVDKSYGIEVAKISGLPHDIIDRARDILCVLEKQEKRKEHESQLSFLEPHIIETIKIVHRDSVLEEKLKNLNVEHLTPLQALNLLWEFKKDIFKNNE